MNLVIIYLGEECLVIIYSASELAMGIFDVILQPVDNRDKILKNEKLIRKPHTNLILGDVIAYDISNVLYNVKLLFVQMTKKRSSFAVFMAMKEILLDRLS